MGASLHGERGSYPPRGLLHCSVDREQRQIGGVGRDVVLEIRERDFGLGTTPNQAALEIVYYVHRAFELALLADPTPTGVPYG